MDDQPPGGTNIHGDANVSDGDFVARDKVVQNINFDIEKVIAALKQCFPEDDPTPRYLLDALRSFQHYHTLLHEWKELHNSLNDVLISFGPFTREIDHSEMAGAKLDARLLRELWRPISRQVDALLEWGKTVSHIGQPFARSEQGLQGAPCFVELCIAEEHLDRLLKSAQLDVAALLDARSEFGDRAETHMYLADKQLRETADELYSLSRVVLGSLHHEQVQGTPG